MPYFLVYVSTASELMTTPQLQALLRTCRDRNAAADISGALLYWDGTFMQVLEGERATVEAVYTTIKADPRHHGVDQLIDGEVAARQFAGWSMAFRDLTAGADELATGFSDFMISRHQTYGADPTVAQRLLLSFRGMLTPT